MPFPVSIKGKVEIKSFLEGKIKPEMLRDAIASSLAAQQYPVHSDNLKIIISTKLMQRSVGEQTLSGLSKGEIQLYPEGTTLIAAYKFSMIHYIVWSLIFVCLLFVFNINNPVTTTTVGIMGLGLLGCILFCGSYILASIMTAIKLPRFIKRCAHDMLEAGEQHI